MSTAGSAGSELSGPTCLLICGLSPQLTHVLDHSTHLESALVPCPNSGMLLLTFFTQREILLPQPQPLPDVLLQTHGIP